MSTEWMLSSTPIEVEVEGALADLRLCCLHTKKFLTSEVANLNIHGR